MTRYLGIFFILGVCIITFLPQQSQAQTPTVVPVPTNAADVICTWGKTASEAELKLPGAASWNDWLKANTSLCATTTTTIIPVPTFDLPEPPQYPICRAFPILTTPDTQGEPRWEAWRKFLEFWEDNGRSCNPV